MTKEVAVIDPKEYGLEESKANEITKGLNQVLAERELLIKEFEIVSKMEITKETIPLFRELRLKVQKNRTQGILIWHKVGKEYFLRGGQFIDAKKRVEVLINENMEDVLLKGEKHLEILEAERVAILETERKAELANYSEVIPSGLGTMDENVYANYLTGIKIAKEARIKAEQEAEAERLRLIEVEKETARLKAIEDERIRKENERLKAEAEAKEKELAAERAKVEAERKAEVEKQAAILDNERQSQAILLEKERAEATRKLKEQQEVSRKEAEKQAAERAKLQSELQAKKDAEFKAQQEKERAEREMLEAEKRAAKAPRKEKLTKWVDSFEIAKFENDLLAMEIEAKFKSFKVWAKQQISNV